MTLLENNHAQAHSSIVPFGARAHCLDVFIGGAGFDLFGRPNRVEGDGRGIAGERGGVCGGGFLNICI